MATAQELTVPQIIQIAKICQVLSLTDTSKLNALKGGALDQRYPYMLYNERKAVEFVYTYNPSDSGLRGIANYLFSLCWKYAAQAQTIITGIAKGILTISNPASTSVFVGANATFSVVVTSPTPSTIQWYLNGIAIPGATSSSYTFLSAQLTDNNDQFSATATNAAGSVSSLNATLTVSAALVGFAFYGSVDYFAALNAGTDNVPYNVSVTILPGMPIVVNWPLAASNNQFEILKYPVSQGLKTTWLNTTLNQGTIPDSVFRAIITIGGYYYICSRTAMSLDSTQLNETFS